MTWFKLDDQITEHPKYVGLSPDAWCLWIHGTAYTSRNLTDGFIPATLLPRLSPVPDIAPVVQELVTAGIWVQTGRGYEIHDYLEHNRSRQDVAAARDDATERQRRSRQQRKRPPVTDVSQRDAPVTRLAESESESEPDICRQSSNRLTTRPVDNPRTDDDDITQLVAQVADTVVADRLARQTPAVRNTRAWITRCRTNLHTDNGGEWWARLEDLCARHPTAPISMLAAAAEGHDTPHLHHHRKTPT